MPPRLAVNACVQVWDARCGKGFGFGLGCGYGMRGVDTWMRLRITLRLGDVEFTISEKCAIPRS